MSQIFGKFLAAAEQPLQIWGMCWSITRSKCSTFSFWEASSFAVGTCIGKPVRWIRHGLREVVSTSPFFLELSSRTCGFLESPQGTNQKTAIVLDVKGANLAIAVSRVLGWRGGKISGPTGRSIGVKQARKKKGRRFFDFRVSPLFYFRPFRGIKRNSIYNWWLCAPSCSCKWDISPHVYPT